MAGGGGGGGGGGGAANVVVAADAGKVAVSLPRPKPAWFEARTPPSCPASLAVEPAHIYLVQTRGGDSFVDGDWIPMPSPSFELSFLAVCHSRSLGLSVR